MLLLHLLLLLHIPRPGPRVKPRPPFFLAVGRPACYNPGVAGFRKEFGEFVKGRRGKEFLESFAARADISVGYLGRLQRGLVPRREKVLAIAAALGEDPLPWLQAAGQGAPEGQQESVAESRLPYRAEGAPGKGDVLTVELDLMVRVDRRTGKVLSVEPRAPQRGKRRK